MDVLKAFENYSAPSQPMAGSQVLREYCLWLVRNKEGKKPGQAGKHLPPIGIAKVVLPINFR